MPGAAPACPWPSRSPPSSAAGSCAAPSTCPRRPATTPTSSCRTWASARGSAGCSCSSPASPVDAIEITYGGSVRLLRHAPPHDGHPRRRARRPGRRARQFRQRRGHRRRARRHRRRDAGVRHPRLPATHHRRRRRVGRRHVRLEAPRSAPSTNSAWCACSARTSTSSLRRTWRSFATWMRRASAARWARCWGVGGQHRAHVGRTRQARRRGRHGAHPGRVAHGEQTADLVSRCGLEYARAVEL